MFTTELATVSYIGATILFILSLGGLSNQTTALRGNLYGMVGMTIAVLATIFGPQVTWSGIPWIIGAMLIGGSIGLYAARTVQMTQMPELVALMHSMVGLSAMLVGISTFIDPTASFHLIDGKSIPLSAAEESIHKMEIYVGILIGAVAFSGSIVAFGKLSGRIGGNPLLLPGRHWLNLLGLLVVIWFGRAFLHAHDIQAGMVPLLVMTVIALLFGIHMVMAIGGADMPVVVSMLNSYSGWAAAATGFMLSNDLLIVVGALVGSSGSGKTTLINLLPRFVEPTAGQITLDGVALADWKLGALRRQYSFVSQDVVMFNDTVAANVALGLPLDRARVQQALEAANLGAFVQALPQGMDSLVGHNAAQLSGGQRQRLAIARALYKDAPILILDEATSALDTESEQAVKSALQRLMAGRTALVIAHRLSTIEHADRIVVMSAGRMVEAGTHEELLRAGGHYARLYNLAATGDMGGDLDRAQEAIQP